MPSFTGIVLEYVRLPYLFFISRERAILAQLRDLLGHARDIQTHREAAGARPPGFAASGFEVQSARAEREGGADERAAEEDRRALYRS